MIDKDRLLELLDEELGVETDDIAGDTALFSSGLVDSFALVTMMMHIEKIAGIQISPGDVTLDNFDSIDRIIAFVSQAK